MKRIKKWFAKQFCKHTRTEFVRNIYGDEINHVSVSTVYRSWHKCLDCLYFVPKGKLYTAEEIEEINWRKENWNKSARPQQPPINKNK